MSVLDIAQLAKSAVPHLQSLPEAQRLMALEMIANALMLETPAILEANQKDLEEARRNHLSPSLTDRLTLSEKSLHALSQMCRDIAAQEQVVGTIVEEYRRPNGLLIQKQRIPLGVIGMIFESRPNVIVDGAALAIKSGNAIILKGGKEAQHSNRKLFEVISGAIERILPQGSVSLIETREDVSELLKLHHCIDLMVPRGGSALIDFVRKNASMPVVAHDKGLCHIYVHEDAKVDAVKIILNAKVQRPGVCNAVETVLIHEKYPRAREIITALQEAGVEIKQEFDVEWLDKKVSLKMVKDAQEAIAHIQQFGSHHTEALLAEDPGVIENFINQIDASAIIINASTRFNDGGELGLGAELGISTSKLHAYGPMGAKEMTTTRFVVSGNGQTR